MKTMIDMKIKEGVFVDSAEAHRFNSSGIEVEYIEHTAPELDFKYEAKPVYDFFKRAMDIVLSFAAVAVLLIPLVLFSLLIVIKDPGSPIFKQERVGKNGKRFYMYKLRSMYKDAEDTKKDLMEQNECSAHFFKIKNDPRILGRLGKFIRKTSVDELPQLFNILKGDMAIVGPRPFVESEQKKMAPERLLVKPGLSCYWQINGKNMLSDEMSDYYDKKYIMERSLWLDIKIIFKTFAVVFKND